ncbi:hypothetical protein P879_06496 [Paragonimus westermani]|uniref:Uncharacterized protein n=2 Tax=Paragonimus westermani TaxID=34504 RepID=A0A8T0DRM7_9TREM|nr:dynein light chain LC8-type [Paragonimus westermani]KAF8569734.1 hypothetical protein P879_06496 [Paragonimus westermani]
MGEVSAIVEGCTMNDEMLEEAVAVSSEAMQQFTLNKDIAAYVKREFDKKYDKSWHCVVGRDYGSFVTHETEHFVDFRLEGLAFLLFKTV